MNLEDKFYKRTDVLTPEEKGIAEYDILGSAFPWYYFDWAVDTAPYPCPFFGHVIVVRPEDAIDCKSWVNSEWYDYFFPIFDRELKAQGLIKKDADILRMALNDTFTWPFNTSGIHRDHENIPHWNCLLYLTTTDGDTIIYDEGTDEGVFTELHREKPVAGTMLIWDGLPLRHAHEFKTKGDERRVVCVATVMKED